MTYFLFSGASMCSMHQLVMKIIVLVSPLANLQYLPALRLFTLLDFSSQNQPTDIFIFLAG